MGKDRRIAKNMIVGGIGQLVVIGLSLLLPRLMIVSYGSDVNGLISTITQAFSYLLLLEHGVGTAAVNRLYRDFAENDQPGINRTLSAASAYFKRLILLYGLGVLLFAIVFPSVIQTTVSAAMIRRIILIHGLSGIVNFAFSNTYNLLLSADGRNYVQTVLNLLVRVTVSLGQILLINRGFSVEIVQSVVLLAAVMRAILLRRYIRRNYPKIRLEKGVSTSILEQKYAYFIHELTTVIFLSTDVFVISLCCGTAAASVYAVYQLIFRSLKNTLNIFMKSVSFRLGQLYNEDIDRYRRAHDSWETLYSAVVFACMTVTLYLTLPFIGLYTSGVSDVSYVDGRLPLLFALIELLSCSRETCSKLISVSGHASKTLPQTMFEAVLNLSVSVFLAVKIGMIGVLLGTIVALLYRSNDIIFYANRRILNRSPWNCYRTHLTYFLLFFVNSVVAERMALSIKSWGGFVAYGFLFTGLMLLLYGTAALLLNKDLRNVLCSKK